MPWERATAATAIAAVLEAIDPAVSVFATPPATFNPPAYVCGVVRTLTYDGATFGIDAVQFRVFVSAGPEEYDRLDALCASARAALAVDPSLAGAVQHLRVLSQENWRRLAVAGADTLTADLILEIRM
jgi:hypothetical protein